MGQISVAAALEPVDNWNQMKRIGPVSKYVVCGDRQACCKLRAARARNSEIGQLTRCLIYSEKLIGIVRAIVEETKRIKVRSRVVEQQWWNGRSAVVSCKLSGIDR